MKPNVYIYILVMAGVTYLIRMLPLVLLRKRSPVSPYIKSFLYYVPVCLPCRNDISGNSDCDSRRYYFRCCGTDRSTDRGIS